MLFAAKCFWPGVTVGEIERLTAGLVDTGTRVRGTRYVGALIFASDELALYLFDCGSAAEARAAAEQATLPCERIMPLTWLRAAKADLGLDPPTPSRRRPS